jgi:hypothetical protein
VTSAGESRLIGSEVLSRVVKVLDADAILDVDEAGISKLANSERGLLWARRRNPPFDSRVPSD